MPPCDVLSGLTACATAEICREVNTRAVSPFHRSVILYRVSRLTDPNLSTGILRRIGPSANRFLISVPLLEQLALARERVFQRIWAFFTQD